MRVTRLVLGAAVMLTLSAAAPALAQGPILRPAGYDVSYPQCSASLPASPAFGIVGVNGGIVFTVNPCLAAQYRWARRSSSVSQARVQFYANTGNPGPALSRHWPTGQQSPRACDGTWSPGCSYDYGWNAARDSFGDAAAAAGGFAAAAAAPWWLDVESANSWSTDASSNTSALHGAADYLTTRASRGGAGVGRVGFYSNSSDWAGIVGSKSAFSGYVSWVPGAGNLKVAKTNCAASITGGRVKYAQYISGGYDADYPCF